MKLNRKTLRKMILQEIRLLKETRQDHLSGIIAKIGNLEQELENVESALEPYQEDAPYGFGEEEYAYIQMDMKDSDHYNNLLNARRVAEDKLEVLYQQFVVLFNYRL